MDFCLFFLLLFSFTLIVQIEYPENVHLIRGNHEAADINALFGFRIECIERMVWTNSMHVFIPSRCSSTLIHELLVCRGKMMEYGHGHGSINFLIIFHLLHLLKRKLSVCMEGLEDL